MSYDANPVLIFFILYALWEKGMDHPENIVNMTTLNMFIYSAEFTKNANLHILFSTLFYKAFSVSLHNLQDLFGITRENFVQYSSVR